MQEGFEIPTRGAKLHDNTNDNSAVIVYIIEMNTEDL
jgi:hypothetical protein